MKKIDDFTVLWPGLALSLVAPVSKPLGDGLRELDPRVRDRRRV